MCYFIHMSVVTNKLLYETLKEIRSDISILKEAVRRVDSRMGAIENLMAGFHNTLNWHGQELDEHRGRLESVEGQNHDPETG